MARLGTLNRTRFYRRGVEGVTFPKFRPLVTRSRSVGRSDYTVFDQRDKYKCGDRP